MQPKMTQEEIREEKHRKLCSAINRFGFEYKSVRDLAEKACMSYWEVYNLISTTHEFDELSFLGNRYHQWMKEQPQEYIEKLRNEGRAIGIAEASSNYGNGNNKALDS